MSDQINTTTPKEILCNDCDPVICEIDGHPNHPDSPCGRHVPKGQENYLGPTICPNCQVTGSWEPATEADVDSLYAEAWGIADLRDT